MDDHRHVADVDEIPSDDTFLFRVLHEGEVREAILLELDDGELACWLNYCQHFTHIKLDKGSGAPLRDGEIICANHGAMFAADTGECTFGPCEGAFLTELDVTVEDGGVYLAEGDCEFVGVGPIETDPTDLTSTSNIEF